MEKFLIVLLLCAAAVQSNLILSINYQTEANENEVIFKVVEILPADYFDLPVHGFVFSRYHLLEMLNVVVKSFVIVAAQLKTSIYSSDATLHKIDMGTLYTLQGHHLAENITAKFAGSGLYELTKVTKDAEGKTQSVVIGKVPGTNRGDGERYILLEYDVQVDPNGKEIPRPLPDAGQGPKLFNFVNAKRQ